MTRLTDYGIMLLTYFARDSARLMRNARDLAIQARLPRPTVSKILKALAHKGLLEARRGARGGFALAKSPEEITVAEIVGALEGPLGITDCSIHSGNCTLEPVCIVRSNWRRINSVVIDALQRITLAEMAHPWRPVELRRTV